MSSPGPRITRPSAGGGKRPPAEPLTLPEGASIQVTPYEGPDQDPIIPRDGFLAAVALILAPVSAPSSPGSHPGEATSLEFLLIRRARHQADPWSGHMALPGGRHDRTDSSLLATAIRETREEVGIDLERSGQLLGCLSVVAPRNSALPPLTILPFVFRLTRPVTPQPASHEIAEALWAPLEVISHPQARSIHHHPVGEVHVAFPAFQVEGRTVWGLTHRILKDFESRLGHARMDQEDRRSVDGNRE
jgi:8-oxo-dGTP pyrophosphatase MutT (NUDIX family)